MNFVIANLHNNVIICTYDKLEPDRFIKVIKRKIEANII